MFQGRSLVGQFLRDLDLAKISRDHTLSIDDSVMREIREKVDLTINRAHEFRATILDYDPMSGLMIAV